MLKKIAVASIVVGLASLVAGVIEKVIVHCHLVGLINPTWYSVGFSPVGFGLGAIIFFLLSINLLLLDKNS